MHISQVAKEAGVSVQTVRLYEALGLIPAPARSPSGYREYSPSFIDDVCAVKNAQRLGFTLAEMKTFVDLQQLPLKSPEMLDAFLQRKITQLDERIAQMQAIRIFLATLSGADYDWNVNGDCPITKLLSGFVFHADDEDDMPED